MSVRTTTAAAALLIAAGATACTHSAPATQVLHATTSPSPSAPPTSATPTPTPTCPSGMTSGFELSLVSDRGGESTPVGASEWFARHGGVGGVPRTGWHLDGSDSQGVFTRSGWARLHEVQGPDKTWQVDSGTTCHA